VGLYAVTKHTGKKIISENINAGNMFLDNNKYHGGCGISDAWEPNDMAKTGKLKTNPHLIPSFQFG